MNTTQVLDLLGIRRGRESNPRSSTLGPHRLPVKDRLGSLSAEFTVVKTSHAPGLSEREHVRWPGRVRSVGFVFLALNQPKTFQKQDGKGPTQPVGKTRTSQDMLLP